MGGEWATCTFEDIVELQRGFDLPAQDRKPGPHPIIASTGKVGTHSIAMVRGPGVVTGRSGSIGGGQFIKDDFWPLNTTLWAKDFNGNNKRYVYYWLLTQDLASFNAGSGVPTLNRNHLRTLPARRPPRDEQDRIADLLGALDDKIELNRRMADTLEATARLLFKSWFVDFDPVRAKAEGRPTGLPDNLAELFPDVFGDDHVPLGWAREPMLEHARLISGGTPKTDEAMFWDGSIPWASAKDVSQCASLFLTRTERTITQLGLDKSATKIVPKLSVVVVARGATTGRRCMLGSDMTINQTCYALSSVKRVPYWLSCAVDGCMDEIVQGGHGSVFNTITISNIQMAKLIIADPKITARFENIVTPVFEQLLVLIEEAATLAAFRDTLLPKLISGELRIRDAEHAAAAA